MEHKDIHEAPVYPPRLEPGPPPPDPREPAGLSRGGAMAIAFGLVLCVAVGDKLTGTDASFILLYLGPIAFGTWFVSFRGGLVLSITSALVSVWVDFAARQHALAAAVFAWNVVVQLGTYLALVLLLDALRGRLEGEQLLARTDALTQVSNRRAFFEAAALELERARRHGRPITFAFVDVDDFKLVNDRLGHAEGDALLVTVAQTLRGATRAVDAVARLGGDEFGVLLPETDGDEADQLVARLRATLAAAVARRSWRVGFSIGVATYREPPASVDEIVARADELMYEVKRGGKGGVRRVVVEGAAASSA